MTPSFCLSEPVPETLGFTSGRLDLNSTKIVRDTASQGTCLELRLKLKHWGPLRLRVDNDFPDHTLLGAKCDVAQTYFK